MAMIQTLLRFLSLDSRPEDFPKTEVDGKVTRTLAILNGLSNGGVRTVQVGKAGSLYVRQMDLRDIIASSNTSITTTNWTSLLAAGFDCLRYCGWAKNFTAFYFTTRQATGQGEINICPEIGGAFNDGVDSYIWFSGCVWVSGTGIKITDTAGAHQIRFITYKLPTR